MSGTAADTVGILMVDDVPNNLVALEAVLGDMGQEIVKAGSGFEALRLVLDRDFAVIILDVQMPELDGFETARLIRERERSRETPIIFLTAASKSETHVSRGYELGAVDYLFKPIVPELIRAKVKVFVALARSTEILKRQLHENQRLTDALGARTAELTAANIELDAFAHSVSHDLRAPLRHIGGFVELLARHLGEGLDEKGRGYVTTITGAVGRMNTLIDDLLAFSRAGRVEMRREEVELAALVAESVRDLAPDLKGREVEWIVPALPRVSGDTALLRQVIENLLSNALKYTRTRERARVEVGFEQGEGEVTVWVKDNGVGFNMAHAERLFGVFQRLHSAAEFEGTGVGLANVRRIITRHGGRTWAEAIPDRGATFYFTLPNAECGMRSAE